MPTPTDEMARVAERALEWREEYNRGGTDVGVARARDISNKRDLSKDTLERMVSYFARHEVDKEAEGFSQGEDGFPSAGRIAWDLWGGNAGKSWANSELSKLESSEEKSLRKAFEGFLEKHFGSTKNGIKVKKSVDQESKQATFLVLKAMSDESDPDLHGDVYYEEDVAKACHSYNEHCNKANLAHLMMIDKGTAYVLESYLSPVDFQMDDQYITKGSWLQVWQFTDDTLWAEVKKGYWNGLSIQCMAEPEEIK